MNKCPKCGFEFEPNLKKCPCCDHKMNYGEESHGVVTREKSFNARSLVETIIALIMDSPFFFLANYYVVGAFAFVAFFASLDAVITFAKAKKSGPNVVVGVISIGTLVLSALQALLMLALLLLGITLAIGGIIAFVIIGVNGGFGMPASA